MKRGMLVILMFSLIIILSGCGEKSRILELEDEIQQCQNENQGYGNEIDRLQDIIKKCNENISEVKSLSSSLTLFPGNKESIFGSPYDRLKSAIGNLPDCEY